MIPDILLPLSISKIHGLGKKSVGKLNNMGIFTVQDLYLLPREFFYSYLGKSGIDIYNRIRGVDDREVQVTRERKSVGKERTLKFNTSDKDELLIYLKDFSEEISRILSSKNMMGKTITLKYKTGEFENHTRSKTLNKYIYKSEDIYSVCRELLQLEDLKDELRLIGVSISSFKETEIEQLSLF